MLETNEVTYIGTFTVDSGQAMVGDPCYLDEWQANYENFEEHPKHKGQYGYLGACNATLTNNYGTLAGGRSVVFTTGYGDGAYPVYAIFNDEGRIDTVIIDFVGSLDDEQE
jgi:hypothetical protein